MAACLVWLVVVLYASLGCRATSLPELGNQVAHRGTVFVTLADYGFIQFAANMYNHFQQTMPHAKLLITTLSQEVYSWCSSRPNVACHTIDHSIDCFYNDTSLELRRPMPFGSKKFLLLSRCKQRVILDLLQSGFNVFWMDTDSVLLQDPFTVLPMNHSWEGACQHVPLCRCHSHCRPFACRRRNHGIMWIRSDNATKHVQKQMVVQMRRNGPLVDEDVYADLASKTVLESYCVPSHKDGLACNWDKWSGGMGRTANVSHMWAVHVACHKPRSKKNYLFHWNLWNVSRQGIYASSPSKRSRLHHLRRGNSTTMSRRSGRKLSLDPPQVAGGVA